MFENNFFGGLQGNMKITVVGLGLMGGSFCKAIKEYTDYECYGYDINPSICEMAYNEKAIDKIANLNDLGDSDVIIICLTPKRTVKFVSDNVGYFKKNSIVSDICGVKAEVFQSCLEKLTLNDIKYVSCHPMAGKETTGFKSSDKNLFVNAGMILIEDDKCDCAAINSFEEIVRKLKFGKIVKCAASKHDEIIAYTSQLAHVVSNAYIKCGNFENLNGFTAGSYQDMTRVAEIDPVAWSELMCTNSKNLVKKITEIITELEKLKKGIEGKEEKLIEAMLEEGREKKLGEREKKK